MAAAAATLHVSPAAVSLGLAELERTLGRQLFLRVRHQPLALTSTGRELLAGATSLVADAEDLQARVDDPAAALSGTLYIGCFTTLAPFVVPGLVAALATTHPALRLDAAEGAADEVQRAVLDGRTELAVLYGIDLHPGLGSTVLSRVRPYVVVAAGHRLARRRRVHLRELADDPIILLASPPSQHHARSVLQAAGVEPPVARTTHSFETLRALVGRGLGWGVLVQRPASSRSYEGLPLATLEIADDVEPAPIVAAGARGARRSRRAEAGLEALVATLVGPARRVRRTRWGLRPDAHRRPAR